MAPSDVSTNSGGGRMSELHGGFGGVVQTTAADVRESLPTQAEIRHDLFTSLSYSDARLLACLILLAWRPTGRTWIMEPMTAGDTVPPPN